MSHRGPVAILGATESTLWTYWLMRNLREYGHPGEVWPVNPNREAVYGTRCFPSIDQLPGVPDLAVVITSADRAVDSTRALAAAGVGEIVVVSDGFRETATAEGAERERALREAAAGAHLIGPNCVGFASFHDRLCAIAEPIPLGLAPGAISVLSQSGVLTHTALAALGDEGLGVDVCYSIGNGALFGFEQAVAAVGRRESTRIVCAVVESIRDRDGLAAAVTEGRAAGVEYVFLLLGQSDDGRRVAQSHTGAIVGDQRVTRAWLRGLGVVVVDSFEELTRSAALLDTVGRPGPRRGVFVLTGSGGAAGLAADSAARCGLPLAQVSAATAQALAEHLLPGTAVGNPLDITTHKGPASTRAIYDLVAGDPAVGILVDPYGLSWPDDSDERRWHRASLETVVNAAAEAEVGLVYTSLMGQPITDFMRRLAKNPRVAVNVGLATTLSSLARLYDHADGAPGTAPAGADPARSAVRTDAATVLDEARARELLGSLGFPVVRGLVAGDPREAAERVTGLRAPWVVKLSLAGLGHKGAVGGVRLGLCTPDDVAEACRQIVSAVTERGLADADDVGFLVQEMEFGAELLVSAVRDPVAGPALIVGVGGWAAEAGTPFAVIPLPASEEEVARALTGGPLPRLLGGDGTGLVPLLHRLGQQFLDDRLGEFSIVECNPVIVTRNGPRIADALLVKNSL